MSKTLKLSVDNGNNSYTTSPSGVSVFKVRNTDNLDLSQPVFVSYNKMYGFKKPGDWLGQTIPIPEEVNRDKFDLMDFKLGIGSAPHKILRINEFEFMDMGISDEISHEDEHRHAMLREYNSLQICAKPRDYIKYNGEYIRCAIIGKYDKLTRGVYRQFAIDMNGDVYAVFTSSDYTNTIKNNGELFKQYNEFKPEIDKANLIKDAFAVIKLYTLKDNEYIPVEKGKHSFLAVTKNVIFRLNEYGEIIGWEIFKNKHGNIDLAPTDEDYFCKNRVSDARVKELRVFHELTEENIISKIEKPIKYKNKSTKDDIGRITLTSYIENFNLLKFELTMDGQMKSRIKYKEI